MVRPTIFNGVVKLNTISAQHTAGRLKQLLSAWLAYNAPENGELDLFSIFIDCINIIHQLAETGICLVNGQFLQPSWGKSVFS
jgi:hypothetical protein